MRRRALVDAPDGSSILYYEVWLVAPQYIRPFLKRQKNDAVEAKAIVIAARLPTRSPAAIRSRQYREHQGIHGTEQAKALEIARKSHS